MPRVKSGVAHHARKKKIVAGAKGARGGRSKLYKPPRRPPNGRCGTPIAIGARRR
jgi:ribosomal protein L20